MRIAWIGNIGDGGGGPSLGGLLLEGLLSQSASVTFYCGDDTLIPTKLSQFSNLELVTVPTWWRWERWYSRHPVSAFVSGTLSRVQTHHRIADALLERNRQNPYDVIFQWSQSELFKLAKHIDQLPPIVVFPGVHAAGELRWHRRESEYARKSESAIVHYLVRCILTYRASRQKREMCKPTRVIALSHRFAQLLAQDYGIPVTHLAVLRHPIDLPCEHREVPRAPGRPVKLLFAGRISVRKGIEFVIELSKRLDDLAGKVVLDVIGDRSQWSDYSAHLKNLNPQIARYHGAVPFAKIGSTYDATDILIVPSMYEPGGLVVGEALSHGVCVVASNEVGSAEAISSECCRRFNAGDMDALERVTRELIADILSRGTTLRAKSREEARSHFAPEHISRELMSILRSAIAVTRRSELEPELKVRYMKTLAR